MIDPPCSPKNQKTFSNTLKKIIPKREEPIEVKGALITLLMKVNMSLCNTTSNVILITKKVVITTNIGKMASKGPDTAGVILF